MRKAATIALITLYNFFCFGTDYEPLDVVACYPGPVIIFPTPRDSYEVEFPDYPTEQESSIRKVWWTQDFCGNVYMAFVVQNDSDKSLEEKARDHLRRFRKSVVSLERYSDNTVRVFSVDRGVGTTCYTQFRFDKGFYIVLEVHSQRYMNCKMADQFFESLRIYHGS